MYLCLARLLFEKRKELGDAASKLKNGLSKIDDTRSKVEAMSVELEDAKTKVAQFQKQCEEYLVVIVQQKREADEQQKVHIHPSSQLRKVLTFLFRDIKFMTTICRELGLL